MDTLDPQIIRTDGGTQARLYLNGPVVVEYAAAMQAGTIFPPIIVYYDGAAYWLADGFHRLAAHKQVRLPDRISVEIRQGTRRDAVLCAVGSNASHGLQRTNDDKRNSVLTLLRDAEWSKWSDREVARIVQVSPTFVGELRKKLTVHVDSDERTYTTKHGTTATMQTANIGKRTEPGASATVPAGKLLVDWTDDDWAAHKAEIEAAVLEVADAPAKIGKISKLSDEEEKHIAIAWLSAYRGPRGANWSQMNDSQIHHANSPCFQAWTKAHPEVGDHKLRIKQALYQLRRGTGALGASATDTQPSTAAAKSDADRRRETIQTAVEDCQRILSRPAYLDAIATATRETRAEHNYVLHGLRTLAAKPG
jgi:hypothetical protein